MKEFLRSLNILSENELSETDNFLSEILLDKGEYFIREGEICTKIAFVQKGVLRSFYHNSEDDEITNCITFENEFKSAYSSFITQTPTYINIQALDKTILLIIEKQCLLELYSSNKNWQEVGRIIAEMQFIELEKRVFAFQSQSATIRYQDLLKNHKNLIKEIPLKYLASYLGITTRHLSRLRSEILL